MSTFFRRENNTANKVANISTVKEWETGNDQLAAVYNAALVWLASLGMQENIFDSYNVSVITMGDCVVKEGAYVVPTTPEGTLKAVMDSQLLRIGIFHESAYPLMVVTKEMATALGAMPEIERVVATWISRQFSSALPVLVNYTFFDNSEAAFAALASGEIDVTSDFMFSGGLYQGVSRRINFQSSCITVATYLSVLTQKWRNVTTISDLERYIFSHQNETLSMGTLGLGYQQFAQSLFGQYVQVVYFEQDTAMYSALMRDQKMVAAIPEYVGTLSAEYATSLVKLGTQWISPNCAYFRKDKVSSCGDNELDVALGEECLSGIGCVNCKCQGPTYKAAAPTPAAACVLACGDGVVDALEECDGTHGCSTDCVCGQGYELHLGKCEKHTLSTGKKVGIIVGSAVGALIIIALIVVIVALVISFPFLRRRFMAEGVKSMHSHMYGRATHHKRAAAIHTVH
eukprot:TRINITY_DN1695_c0_g1_i4.p1 TRINITY_DN1695_c0_g1~~TRINITY_DN1695_c0_g1_i4.p1  ORF type:complete len:458 (-),score=90.45 TRINITY_DN1695_c0_g1_i4:29-1402(-)